MSPRRQQARAGLALPLGDQVRVNLEFGRQLRQGGLAPQGTTVRFVGTTSQRRQAAPCRSGHNLAQAGVDRMTPPTSEQALWHV